MYHRAPPDYLALTAYSLVLLYGLGMGVFLTRQGNKAEGSYLTSRQERVMQFRRPLSSRRSLLAIAGFYALMILAIVVANRHILVTPSHLLVAGFFCVDTPLFLAFLVYLAGPNDIRLDGDRLTYERTTGWPWRPRTRTGPFEDFKGVCVSSRYGVMLLLKYPGWNTKGLSLGAPSTRVASEALAEEVSREFGFLIVPYPR